MGAHARDVGLSCDRPKTGSVHFNASASAGVSIVHLDTQANDIFVMHSLVDIRCHFTVAAFVVSVGDLEQRDVGAVRAVATGKEHVIVALVLIHSYLFILN